MPLGRRAEPFTHTDWLFEIKSSPEGCDRHSRTRVCEPGDGRLRQDERGRSRCSTLCRRFSDRASRNQVGIKWYQPANTEAPNGRAKIEPNRR